MYAVFRQKTKLAKQIQGRPKIYIGFVVNFRKFLFRSPKKGLNNRMNSVLNIVFIKNKNEC